MSDMWANEQAYDVTVPQLGTPTTTSKIRDTKTKTGDEGVVRAYRLRKDKPKLFMFLVDSVYWAGKAPHTGTAAGKRKERDGECFLVKTPQGCWVRQDGQRKALYQLPRRVKEEGEDGNGFYAHVIMAVLFATRAPDIGDQASHLCNVHDCCNPWHLVIETGLANMLRRLCAAAGRCNGAHGGPACINL